MGNEIHNLFFMNADINPSVSNAQRKEVREAVESYNGPVTRIEPRKPQVKFNAVLTKIIKTPTGQDMCIVVQQPRVGRNRQPGPEIAITVDRRFKGFFAQAKTGDEYRFDLTRINLRNGFDKGDFFSHENRGYVTDYALNKEPQELDGSPKAKKSARAAAANGQSTDPEP